MSELNNQQFIEAHNRANGEGDEYITNLALELAGVLTKNGIKINGQRLIQKLNSIANNDGIETIKNAALLQTRLQLNEIIEPSREESIINPEDIYTKTLLSAYTTSISMSMSIGQEIIVCINNMSCEFSKAFKEHDIRISESQIKNQLSIMIKHQMGLDRQDSGLCDPEKSAMEIIIHPEQLIQNLCIHLQLAGHLE